MSNIKKLGGLLNKIYESGKLPKCCTLSDVSTLQCVYNEMASGNKHPEFIQFGVKTVLESIGFMLAPKGIGWIVIS